MIDTIRKFLLFTGKHRKAFLNTIWLSLAHALFDALRLVAIAYVLAALISGGVGVGTAAVALAIMTVSLVGSFLTLRASTLRRLIGSYRMVADMRLALGDRLRRMPMGYFNEGSLGAISAAATGTVQSLQELGARAIQACLEGFVATTVIALCIFAFDWRIGIIVLVGVIAFAGANAWLQRRARTLDKAMEQANAKLEGAVLEYLRGMGVVKSYNLDRDANKRINREIGENRELNFGMEKAFIPAICLQSIVLKVFSLLIVLASISFYLSGTMGLMECLLMVITSFFVYGPLEGAGDNSALLRSVDKSLDAVNSVRDTPVMAYGSHGRAAAHDLRLDHVSFSYEDGREVVSDVSMAVPERTTCAIVGPSGSGKTTLVLLMARFWDVDEGRVALGGTPLHDYTADALMANYSMVFQNPYLFNDTVANNIRFGRPEATMDEVVEAARRARCHEFVSALPQGYDTMVGEGGTSLSGGEKQRLSIARALLKDAPVIFLDEATASVDPENEVVLQASLRELTSNKTVVKIAHRLKTVADADQIVVIDGGRIVQRGTHAELMREGGMYARFVGMREQALGWSLGGKGADV